MLHGKNGLTIPILAMDSRGRLMYGALSNALGRFRDRQDSCLAGWNWCKSCGGLVSSLM